MYTIWVHGAFGVDYGTDEVVPHGSAGPDLVWLEADQLPDLPRKLNYFRLTEYECVSLGKKLSFHLRALARERNVKTVDLVTFGRRHSIPS